KKIIIPPIVLIIGKNTWVPLSFFATISFNFNHVWIVLQQTQRFLRNCAKNIGAILVSIPVGYIIAVMDHFRIKLPIYTYAVCKLKFGPIRQFVLFSIDENISVTHFQRIARKPNAAFYVV